LARADGHEIILKIQIEISVTKAASFAECLLF